MKHVLIPTDFTIGSLQPVHAAMAHYPAEQVRITLLHLLEPPHGIGDLLFRAGRKEPVHLISPAFRDACAIICNRYGSRLADLKTVFQYGSTPAYLRNLLDGLSVDLAVLDPAYRLALPHLQSVLLQPLLQRSGVRLLDAGAYLNPLPAAPVSFSSLLQREGDSQRSQPRLTDIPAH